MMSIAYDYSREMTSPASASTPRLLLIDGQRVPSASGRTFKTLNPATEQVIATIAEGNEVDVDRAVAAARRAFEGPWRTMRAAERGHILLRLVDLMKEHGDEIAALESLDAGKPISGVLRQDLPAAIDTLTITRAGLTRLVARSWPRGTTRSPTRSVSRSAWSLLSCPGTSR